MNHILLTDARVVDGFEIKKFMNRKLVNDSEAQSVGKRKHATPAMTSPQIHLRSGNYRQPAAIAKKARPITSIDIYFSINGINEYFLRVSPNLTFAELKSQIYESINVTPIKQLYPLVEATLTHKTRKELHQTKLDKSLKMALFGCNKLEQADDQTCIVVFPIYPPRFTWEKVPKNELDWMETVQIHGCRCADGTKVNALIKNWPRSATGDLLPLDVIYTPYKRKVPSFRVRDHDELEDSVIERFTFLSIVQRTNPRIIGLPNQDVGGQMDNMYVRDTWVDYSDRMINQFKLSEGAISIPTPIPDYVYNEDDENEDDVIKQIPALSRVPHWVEQDNKLNSSIKDFLKDVPTSNAVPSHYYVEGHPGTGKTEMQLYFLYRLIHTFARLIIVYDFKDIPTLFIKVDKTQEPEIVVEQLKSDRSQFQDVDYFPVIGLFDSVKPETRAFFTYVGSPHIMEKHLPENWNGNMELRLPYPLWKKKEFWHMLQLVYPRDPTPWLRSFPVVEINILNYDMKRILLCLPEFDAEESPLDIVQSMNPHQENGFITLREVFGLKHPITGTSKINLTTSPPALIFPRQPPMTQKQLNSLSVEERLDLSSFRPNWDPAMEEKLQKGKEIILNVIDLFGLTPRALTMKPLGLMHKLGDAIKQNTRDDLGMFAARSYVVATASRHFPISLYSNLLFLDNQLSRLGMPLAREARSQSNFSVQGYEFEEQVIYSMIDKIRYVTVHTSTAGKFKGKKLLWSFKLGLRRLSERDAQNLSTFEQNTLYAQSIAPSSQIVPNTPFTGIDAFFWQPHKEVDLFCAVQITLSSKHSTPNMTFFNGVLENFKTFARGRKKPVVSWFLWIVPNVFLETYLGRTDVEGYQLVGAINANELIVQQVTQGHPQQTNHLISFEQHNRGVMSDKRHKGLQEETDTDQTAYAGLGDTDEDRVGSIKKHKRTSWRVTQSKRKPKTQRKDQGVAVYDQTVDAGISDTGEDSVGSIKKHKRTSSTVTRSKQKPKKQNKPRNKRYKSSTLLNRWYRNEPAN
ncbi:hypothetical protein BLNAU_8748 [Blattamonas nauphoetae]|uniref:Ubiquitin-like domain-containing protein n=1 Tax=Blattamonas nauphoetae TaxID=2049346 RepID=A0ABQ9XXH7_9EUKA|nr:hypothetical protein BLNAU_8748 [Blattamonas nauphoetae]